MNYCQPIAKVDKNLCNYHFTPQIKGSNCGTQLAPPLWLSKIFTPFQQEFTVNSNKISHQQLWNVTVIVVIVL